MSRVGDRPGADGAAPVPLLGRKLAGQKPRQQRPRGGDHGPTRSTVRLRRPHRTRRRHLRVRGNPSKA